MLSLSVSGVTLSGVSRLPSLLSIRRFFGRAPGGGRVKPETLRQVAGVTLEFLQGQACDEGSVLAITLPVLHDSRPSVRLPRL